MASDIANHFYASLSLPLQDRVVELSRLIDQASPFKELQALFPQLISSVFGAGSAIPQGWGLRTITHDNNPYEFVALHRFLSPLGPMFTLCYKLLGDPQLKYHFPLSMLPLDVQQMLERGRYPQFYSDLINIDSQTIQLVSLTLNPLDYYMFHFATHLLNSNVNKFTWESSSVYIALACDYLTHFLPADPSVAITPHIPYYTGKIQLVVPLQTATRQLHSPSLLLIQDLPGFERQHSPASTQSQSRNELWRTETVLQVFTDIWLSIDDYCHNPMDSSSFTPQKSPLPSTTGERVKVARMLVKQMHTFSSKHTSDPAPRSSALRKCARQTVCSRVYKFVTYLVATWPLDSSFRLVLELWLSTIQPWRYTDIEMINSSTDRYLMQIRRQEDRSAKQVDPSYMQFLAENFPTYTTIFQLMIPRFMRLDLTVPKNAIMVFRLAKVFGQPNLIHMLREIETAALGQNIGLNHSSDINWNISFNYGMQDASMTNKWGSIAKQAIAELNPAASACYRPMWGDAGKEAAFQLVRRLAVAKIQAARTVADIEARLLQQNKGFWSSFNFWSTNEDDDFLLADRKAVPTYLGTAIQYFSEIFGFDSSLVVATEEPPLDSHSDTSSMLGSSHTSHSTLQLRSAATNVKYMGDPELIPIGSHECTILVRMFYQLSTRINEMYQQELWELWRRQDLWGHISREIIQNPRTIHTYTKGGGLVSESLPPRISLRRYASHAFLVWLTIGYLIFYLLGYGAISYFFVVFLVNAFIILSKALLKQSGLLNQEINNTDS